MVLISGTSVYVDRRVEDVETGGINRYIDTEKLFRPFDEHPLLVPEERHARTPEGARDKEYSHVDVPVLHKLRISYWPDGESREDGTLKGIFYPEMHLTAEGKVPWDADHIEHALDGYWQPGDAVHTNLAYFEVDLQEFDEETWEETADAAADAIEAAYDHYLDRFEEVVLQAAAHMGDASRGEAEELVDAVLDDIYPLEE